MMRLSSTHFRFGSGDSPGPGEVNDAVPRILRRRGSRRSWRCAYLRRPRRSLHGARASDSPTHTFIKVGFGPRGTRKLTGLALAFLGFSERRRLRTLLEETRPTWIGARNQYATSCVLIWRSPSSLAIGGGQAWW